MTESSVLKIILVLHFSSFRCSLKLIRISNYIIFVSNLYQYMSPMPRLYIFLYPLELCFNEYVECCIHFLLFTSIKYAFPLHLHSSAVVFIGGTLQKLCKYLSGKKSIILMFRISTVLVFKL